MVTGNRVNASKLNGLVQMMFVGNVGGSNGANKCSPYKMRGLFVGVPFIAPVFPPIGYGEKISRADFTLDAFALDDASHADG